MSPRLCLAALCALALGGCGLSFDVYGVANACVDSSTCGEGSCVDGRCVTLALDAPMQVAFELVPARDASQPPAAASLFAPITIEGAVDQELALHEQITVSGGAYFGAGRVRVPAQLTFTPRPLFEGAPTSSVRVSSDLADYAVVLDAGRVYDVLVEPTATLIDPLVLGLTASADPPANDLFPPLYVEGVSLADFESGRLDLAYPEGLFEPCAASSKGACTFEGRVLSVDAEGVERAEPGLRVRAIDAAGRAISSSLVTGLDGSYAIRLVLPSEGATSLRVSPVLESSSLPTALFPIALGSSGVDNAVRLPRLETATLEAVVGYEPGSEVDGISFLDGAAVSFESTRVDGLELGGELSFRRTVATATTALGAGSFEVALLPGSYRVVVTPADRDRASVLVTELTIDPMVAGSRIQGQYYRVPLRTLVTGAVLAPDLGPLPNATVHALRVTPGVDVGALDIRRFARASSAVADASGVYALPLDVGVYDLLAAVGSGSGFAWELFQGVTVSEVGGVEALDLPFVAPLPVGGRALDAAGAPLPGATVRAYVLLDDGEGARARQVGEATTDADGRYELMLPSALGPR